MRDEPLRQLCAYRRIRPRTPVSEGFRDLHIRETSVRRTPDGPSFRRVRCSPQSSCSDRRCAQIPTPMEYCYCEPHQLCRTPMSRTR